MQPTTTTMPTVDRAIFRRGMRLVASYVRMHPKPFAASVAGAVLFAFASLFLTEALGRATDDVLREAFGGEVVDRDVWLAVGALMLGGVGRALGIMLRRYYSGVAGERVMATLRTRVAERYRELSLRYHRETPTGELLAHMEVDVKAAVDVFWPVPFAIGVIVLTLLALVALVVTDPVLALIGLVVFPSLALMNRIFARRIEEPMRLAQQRIGEVSAVAHESIDGALVVKTLGRERGRDRTPAREGGGAARRAGRGRGHARVVRGSALDALPTMAIAFLLAVGAWRVSSDAITLGDAHRVRRAVPTALVADAVHRLDPGRAAARRRRLRPARGGLRGAGHRDAAAPGGAASRRAAGPARARPAPAYEQQAPVLDGVTFEVEPDESVAIVGPTGVGKSTLTQLMVRLVDPDEGDVEIGGVDLREVDVASLRTSVAVVFQESFLFAESVRANIALDSGATDEQVVRAAEIASCDRFIRALPRGYDTVVGERGLTLSGGERQRVALARALVREPRLLILDDATSAVDPSIEADILGALRKELSTTLVVVAYRLSTIRLADRVIFLRRGRVEATGSHEQLLATPARVRRDRSRRTSEVSDERRAARAARRRRRAAGARGAEGLVRCAAPRRRARARSCARASASR